MSQTRAQKKHSKQLKRNRKAKAKRIQKQSSNTQTAKMAKFEKIIAHLQAAALKAKYDIADELPPQELSNLDLDDD